MSASDGARRGELLAIAFVAVFAFSAFAGSVVARLALQDAAPSAGGESTSEIAEGQHPLYIVKEVVETTGDWAAVEWIRRPDPVVPRHEVVDGSDAPGLEWRWSDLSLWIHKDEGPTRVVIEVEALAFRGDSTALVNVSRQDAGAAMGYVKSEFYAFNRTADDFTKLGEVLLEEGDYGPVYFELDLSAFYDAPSATANVERAVKELDKKVLAFYYNWYCPSCDPPPGEWGEPIADTPLMGPYDSADEGVILAHMAMAKYAGIDGFIAHFYPPGSHQAENFPTVLRLAEENGLAISAYSSVEPLTLASHPAWLKDAGRPVFFFWAPGARDPSEWLEWRREVEDAIGPVVWIGNTLEEDYLGVFDGFHVYICMPNYPGDDCRDYWGEAIERMRVGPRKMTLEEAFSLAYSGGEVTLDLKSFSVSVIPGNDDTKIRSPGNKVDREGGALYERLWRTAIDLDAHSVLITSWNEWYEGTEIEPSREYGFDYLALTRQFVEEYKQTTLPTPEASFSATIDAFELYPSMTGNGSITLASTGQAPLVIVRVDIAGLEGAFDVDLQGDFYAYLRQQNETYVSVVIPSVPSLSQLAVEAAFTADVTTPLLGIHVTAYDPSGALHVLFKGQLRISDKLKEMIERVVALQAEVDALEAEVRALQQEIGTLQAQAAALQAEVDDLVAERDSLQAEKSSLEEQISALNELITAREEEIRTLNQDIGDLTRQLSAAAGELSQKEAALENALSDLSSADEGLTDAEAELASLQAEAETRQLLTYGAVAAAIALALILLVFMLRRQ